MLKYGAGAVLIYRGRTEAQIKGFVSTTSLTPAPSPLYGKYQQTQA